MPPPAMPLFDYNCLTFAKGLFNTNNIENIENGTCPYFLAARDVSFDLYTPKNPTEPQILKMNDFTSVKNSNFDRKLPTRMLIHGWGARTQLAEIFADAYFVKGKHKVNFISVHWEKGSHEINYFCSRDRVNEVGEYVARFIDFMSKEFVMIVSKLAIIGHSLGAHAAGIGKEIERKNY